MNAVDIKFFKNSVSASSGSGGALGLYDSDITLSGSSFANNTAFQVSFFSILESEITLHHLQSELVFS
jgi:hypothetical protein